MQGTLCRKQPRDPLQCSASAVQQRANITCNAQVAEGMSCPLLVLEVHPRMGKAIKEQASRCTLKGSIILCGP